jgi:hypothetical protein
MTRGIEEAREDRSSTGAIGDAAGEQVGGGGVGGEGPGAPEVRPRSGSIA